MTFFTQRVKNTTKSGPTRRNFVAQNTEANPEATQALIPNVLGLRRRNFVQSLNLCLLVKAPHMNLAVLETESAQSCASDT